MQTVDLFMVPFCSAEDTRDGPLLVFFFVGGPSNQAWNCF